MTQVANNSAQVADGSVSNPGPEGGQAANQAAQQMVTIPRENLNGLAAMGVDINDRNSLVALAKLGARARHEGYEPLMEQAQKHGYNGHRLTGELMGLDEWDFSARRNPGASGSAEDGSLWDPNAELEAARAAQAAAQGGNGEGQANTTDEQWRQYIRSVTEPIIRAGIENGIKEYDGTVKKTQAQKEQEARQKAELEASFEAERQAMEELLGEAGYKPDPQDVPWLGATRKADIRHEMLWAGIVDIAQKLKADTIDPTDPQRDAKLARGVEKHFVRQAFEIAKPHLTAADAKAVQKAVTKMAKLPGATLPAGAGGTPNPDVANMTPDQRAHAAVEKARSRGKVRQNYT